MVLFRTPAHWMQNMDTGFTFFACWKLCTLQLHAYFGAWACIFELITPKTFLHSKVHTWAANSLMIWGIWRKLWKFFNSSSCHKNIMICIMLTLMSWQIGRMSHWCDGHDFKIEKRYSLKYVHDKKIMWINVTRSYISLKQSAMDFW